MLPVALALSMAAPSALAARAAPDRAPSLQMQSLLQNCDAHKFETIVELDSGGTVKHSRVKLCGTEGQSDADWIRTLKDAVAKTETNANMPASARAQIVGAIKAEIARLQGTVAPAGSAALPPPRSTARAAPLDGFTALPPLPDRPPPAVHVLPGGSAALPLLPRPQMTFTCMTPGEFAEGPCTDFSRDTLLTVHAGEDLPPGTSLRFVRSGEARADVPLAQLKRGRSLRLALPAPVCSHAAGGRLEIRIVRSVPAAPAAPDAAGQEVGEDGPYNLRC